MTGTSDATRVLVVGETGPNQQQVIAAFGAAGEFKLVDVLAPSERLTREVRAAEPQIVLIDYQIDGQPALDIIDELVLQFPELALVAILPSNDPLVAQQVMLAGVRAFIVQPFTQVNLLSTLRRVRDLESRRQKVQTAAQAAPEAGAKPLRTLAIFSPRGGAGCSTVAVNLAIAMHKETSGRVLLLEGKLLFGNLALMLNIRTANTLADLVPHANALDETLVREVVFEHISGVHVLLSPADLQAAQGIRAQDLFNLLAGLQRLYEFIVIDMGNTVNENAVTLMDMADRILLVANPDLTALYDIGRFIQLSRTLSYPPDKLFVVLNRAGQPGGLRTQDVEKALHHELFAQIPEDMPNVLRSLNRGIPYVFNYPRRPVSQAFRRLAQALACLNGAEHDAQPAAAAGKARLAARIASRQAT